MKKNKKIKGLTIQFIPYTEIEMLKSGERIKKLLDIVLSGKIIILQGRLKSEEEARLIEDTMAMVGHIKDFKGIELAVINPNQEKLSMMSQVKHGLARALGAQDSITIMGPASIVREIKRDPKKIEILMNK
ncbi:hypothetical protein A3K73_02025 [Candidatus Pacearchaeota archaeon RBG_13_36_9]|nr:MAG: hypothetical protein A3K73_02025 [Candidatus Pacearchaeota archaeon RBG_13_36_9]